MRNNPTTYPAIIAQRFFAQRFLELLHRKTIDSYRLRVLNPLFAVTETLHVYEGLKLGKIKNKQTLLASIAECAELLKKDDVLEYIAIDKEYIIEEVLRKINKDNCSLHFVDVRHVFTCILNENTKYCHNLLLKLRGHLYQELNPDPYPHLGKIDDLTGNLVTELIRLGFSKSYLFSLVRSMPTDFSPEHFDDFFAKIEAMPDLQPKGYRVWFFVYAQKPDISRWENFKDWQVDTDISERVHNHKFGKSRRNHLYLGKTVEALDHYAALQIAKQSLAEVFDVFQLAYHNESVEVQKLALVVDLANPVEAKLQQVRYLQDGDFPAGQEVMSSLIEKLPKVIHNPNIRPETKEKIKSAFRYLRYGNEAFELEHQFINYWIGLEYLFSNEQESTFTRLKTIFPILQVLVYLPRNLAEFHRATAELPISDWEFFSPDDIQCLLREDALKEVRDKVFEAWPLRSFRAWKILNRIVRKDSDGVIQYLEKHHRHLEWHLIRIYRVRNEIVHEAKHSFQNQTLSSNLRYYLAFALSLILDYFSRHDSEAANIEDYYSLQIFKHKHLKHEKFPQHKLLDLKYDFEILT